MTTEATWLRIKLIFNRSQLWNVGIVGDEKRIVVSGVKVNNYFGNITSNCVHVRLKEKGIIKSPAARARLS